MKRSIFSLVVGTMLIAQPVSAASIAELQAQVHLLVQILQQLIAQVALLPTIPTATPEPIYCTAEYRPVCGQYGAIRVTYSNKCELDKANATYLYEGACQNTPPIVANVPPVINGISGPTQLQVNEVGTWRISAYDRDNDTLTYSVSWGDEPVYWFNRLTSDAAVPKVTAQDATLQHAYSKAGRYTVKVTVSDTAGHSTSSSITVFVSGIASNPITDNCRQWFDGCNSCGRSYPGGPARCTLRACIPENTQQPYCKEYFGSSTGTCIVDDMAFVEGQSTNCINDSNGNRTCIADASFVCRSGEWRIEGGYPAI